LDAMYHSPEKISDNPMDPNWGGVQYSREVVDSGKYKDNEIKLNDREVFDHREVVAKSFGDENEKRQKPV